MPDERFRLPQQIGTGVMHLGPLEIPVAVLNDGRRIVTDEGLQMFFDWLESGGPPGAANDEHTED